MTPAERVAFVGATSVFSQAAAVTTHTQVHNVFRIVDIVIVS
jgi:hypothetical protein